MGEKVLICAPFVRFQGIIEDYLEVGGLVGGGCGCRVSMGHNGENEEAFILSRLEEDIGFVGMADTASRSRALKQRTTAKCGRHQRAESRAIKKREFEDGTSELTRKPFYGIYTFGRAQAGILNKVTVLQYYHLGVIFTIAT